MAYEARLKAPNANNKNYIHYSAGGYNYCIKVEGNSVLPNCVGYAWGRWREIIGAYHNLSRNNAESWYVKDDGYARGQEPKLGAVACWSKGIVGNEDDGAGHVAIVEQINADGSIVVSESAWNGARFRVSTFAKPYVKSGGYKFQGFIYNPAVKDEPKPTPDPVKEFPKEHIVVAGDTLSKIANKYYGNGDAEHYLFIAKSNNIANPNIISVGQKLIIPEYKTQPIPQLKVGDRVMLTADAVVYGKGYKFSGWVYKAKLYVREISGERVVISTVPTGAITGAVDIKHLKKV